MLCPQCNSLLIAQSPSAGLLNRLLSLVSIYPFQCQMCRYRFRARQKESREFAGGAERRRASRTPVRIPVNFEWEEGQGDGVVTDISEGGCALDSKRQLKPGLILRLQFPAGTERTPDIPMSQIVTIRSVSGNRAGVKFLTFTPQEYLQLNETVARSIRMFANRRAE